MDLIQENISLNKLNSWKVGGSAEFFAQPKSKIELKEVYQWAYKNNHPVTVLSGGTNVLISDDGIDGLTIQMSELKSVQQEITPEKMLIVAEAGLPKMNLMRIFMKYKLAPALFLSGLPGEVGGGVYMNAGVREKRAPKEFVEIVDWVEVLKPDTMEYRRYLNEEIQWSYRSTKGWQPGVIYKVGFSCTYDPIDDIPRQVMDANRLRKSKQPLDMPSCGSTFRNPEGNSAGALIEQCGLKGFSIGGVQVSEKHANFLVNTGEGTASDVVQLIEHIQKMVFSKREVALKTEVVHLGF